MQTSVSEFMKIAAAVMVIAGLLFFVGYKMIDDEAKQYETTIKGPVVPVSSGAPANR
jgi:hypothetical protein